MSDNEALREILGEARLIEGILRGAYDDILYENAQAVTLAAPYARTANPNAVKTVITNRGAALVKVYEEGALVAALAQYAAWVSPTSGAGALQVTCATSGTIAVATYVKL